jgi:Flp pilus assembly protein TadG
MVLHQAERSCGAPRGRKGAHIAEFAFIAPWFFLILLGIFEVGRGLMVTELLAAGARAGCRVGVLPGKSSTDVQTAANNFLSSVGISGDTVYVNGTAVSGTGTDPLTNAASGTEITVQVQVPVANITWMPVTNFLTGNLSGQFTMRRE